jgi:lipopolysaccharide/colanic/teichoic acid biosynthesis glycosyltransferase
MALVGPRPEAPAYVDVADSTWQAVLAARPGIAGPTQLLVADWEAAVVGTGDGDLYAERILPVKLAIDRWYVEHASPRVDGLVLVGLARRLLGLRRPGRLEHLVGLEVPERLLSRA